MTSENLPAQPAGRRGYVRYSRPVVREILLRVTNGESVKAIVVLRPGRTADAEPLIAYCREHLAGFKVPRSVDFLASLPKSDRGKILKHDLRERYWSGRESRVI